MMEIELGEITTADDRRFTAIASDDRRRVLSALDEADARMSLTELAADVVDAESRFSDPGPEPERVQEMTVELYHRHLPRLADAGLVDFDRSQRTVALAVEVDASDATELLVA
jgi:predicted transcriptional regulator